MISEFSQLFPVEAGKILLVLFLSFLIGLEREEHRAGSKVYAFGGVRTFPLIGLIGYVMALLSGDQLLPVAIGFAVVGAFLLISYFHKLSASADSGVTTEVSALGTYLLGPLVFHGFFWIATTVAIISVLLLELKEILEGMTRRFAPEEILTFTKFLLLTAVVLPILPNEAFSRFQINPFKTWLVVVAVSAISYGSYVLLNLTKNKSGVLISAVLGGAYSSTITTVALAKRATQENRPHLFSGGVLIASGVMYLRLALLLALFNRSLTDALAVSLLVLGAIAATAGWLWSRIADVTSQVPPREFQPKNPLELRAALLFAALFVAILVLTRLVVDYAGARGMYLFAGVMGLTDVDPFIMGLAATAGKSTPLTAAAASILIAAASNSLVKGAYAYGFSDRQTGVQSLGLLTALAIAGLVPLMWLLR